MTVHLIKLAAGVSDLRQLALKQQDNVMPYKGMMAVPVWTRRAPRRDAEVLRGGSLYWVVRNNVMVRQSVMGIERAEDDEYGSYCLIMLSPDIVRVRPIARKPFQGWRYFKDGDIPDDYGAYEITDCEENDPAIERDLLDIGLI